MRNIRSRAADLVGALIIPTGIGAFIGGDAGDATPVAKMMAAVCDWLFIHPNVVNASDINEMPENALYVDGHMLDQFMVGNVGLVRCSRQNRILVIVNFPLSSITLNAVNAARHTLGADITILVLPAETPLTMTADFAQDGTATGVVSGVRELVEAAAEHRFDVVALHTVIDTPAELAEAYFRDGGVNPWGGVEAGASRLISETFQEAGANVPVAHAPLELEEVPTLTRLQFETVAPRVAAEVISCSYLHCVLKGLHDCPLAVQMSGLASRVDWTARDLDFIVTPAGALPEAALKAARDFGTTLIRVRENATVIDEHLPGTSLTPGVYAENYLEAAGMVACMRAGVMPKSVRA